MYKSRYSWARFGHRLQAVVDDFKVFIECCAVSDTYHVRTSESGTMILQSFRTAEAVLKYAEETLDLKKRHQIKVNERLTDVLNIAKREE